MSVFGLSLRRVGTGERVVQATSRPWMAYGAASKKVKRHGGEVRPEPKSSVDYGSVPFQPALSATMGSVLPYYTRDPFTLTSQADYQQQMLNQLQAPGFRQGPPGYPPPTPYLQAVASYAAPFCSPVSISHVRPETWTITSIGYNHRLTPYQNLIIQQHQPPFVPPQYDPQQSAQVEYNRLVNESIRRNMYATQGTEAGTPTPRPGEGHQGRIDGPAQAEGVGAPTGPRPEADAGPR